MSMSKIVKVISIISIALIMVKILLNSIVILMELYELKMKMKIRCHIYKWKMCRIMENYGIPKDIANRLSKDILKEELKVINNLLSIRGLMKILGGKHIYRG